VPGWQTHPFNARSKSHVKLTNHKPWTTNGEDGGTEGQQWRRKLLNTKVE
jgi:hypothetical protein